MAIELLSSVMGYGNTHLSRMENDLRALEAKASGYVSFSAVIVAIAMWAVAGSSVPVCSKIFSGFSLLASAFSLLCSYNVLKSSSVPSAPTPGELLVYVSDLYNSLQSSPCSTSEDFSAVLRDIYDLFLRSADKIESISKRKAKWLWRLEKSSLYSLLFLIVGVLIQLVMA